MSFINFLKNCHDKNTNEQYKRGSVLEFNDERASEIIGAGVAKEVSAGGESKEETQLVGWTSIIPNTFEEMDLDQYDYDVFTILFYMRKGSNRQGVKFELTKSELRKILSKTLTNEVVITRACQGVSNVNNIAMIRQTVQHPANQEGVDIGTIKIKYQFIENGSEVTGLDNFEWCMYAR